MKIQSGTLHTEPKCKCLLIVTLFSMSHSFTWSKLVVVVGGFFGKGLSVPYFSFDCEVQTLIWTVSLFFPCQSVSIWILHLIHLHFWSDLIGFTKLIKEKEDKSVFFSAVNKNIKHMKTDSLASVLYSLLFLFHLFDTVKYSSISISSCFLLAYCTENAYVEDGAIAGFIQMWINRRDSQRPGFKLTFITFKRKSMVRHKRSNICTRSNAQSVILVSCTCLNLKISKSI